MDNVPPIVDGVTAEYANFLVSAAKLVFEDEISARLNVARIEETDAFDSLSGLRDGLRMARTRYAGAVGRGRAGLVHALLGRDLGGGIAFVGESPRAAQGARGVDAIVRAFLARALTPRRVPFFPSLADTVCDTAWGLGLSTGLRGRMDHLDGEATQ